ncbi:MAG: hypothetical protein K8L99_32615 [Anaerolineae bacterium]|nr:hypothetical protein [Anaerolineae bacterium]
MGPNFGDFFSQIPSFLIIIFCGSGILLLASIVALVRIRAVKAQNQFYTPDESPTYAYIAPEISDDASDLPDLDLLVNTPQQVPPTTVTPTPSPVPRARSGMQFVTLSDGSSTEAVEVMSLLRDVVSGDLIIQMGEKSYRDLSSDETFKNSFLKIMRELSPIVKNAPAAAAPPTEQHIETAAEEPAPPAQPQPTAPPRPTMTPPPPEKQPPLPPSGGIIPGALPKYDIDHEPAQITKRGLFRRGKLDLPPVPELDIAGRIETYLQHKLQVTPEYAGRSIHVHPAPDGGVAIEVDGIFYDAVNDITDDEIRQFLSNTIREWQEQS